MRMILCQVCRTALESRQDPNAVVFPWFRNAQGNHTGIVCLKCGTVHDCVGSLNFAATLLGGSVMKVVRYITPDQLKAAIKELAFEANEADDELGIPESLKMDYSDVDASVWLQTHFEFPADVAQAMVDRGFV